MVNGLNLYFYADDMKRQQRLRTMDMVKGFLSACSQLGMNAISLSRISRRRCAVRSPS
jgi:hypothetical protein